jgi:hypothetical protein
MLNADPYAGVVDRHVELAADIAGLGSLLDYFEATDDDGGRRRKSRSNATIQIHGDFAGWRTGSWPSPSPPRSSTEGRQGSLSNSGCQSWHTPQPDPVLGLP